MARYHRLLSILIAAGLVFRDRQLVSHTAVRCGLNWSTYCVQPLGPAQHREMSGTQISYSQRSLVNRGQRKLRIVQSQKKTRKLLDKLGIHRKRVGFYALRHTFKTIGGESRDQVAVDHIVGHVDQSVQDYSSPKCKRGRLRVFPSACDSGFNAQCFG